MSRKNPFEQKRIMTFSGLKTKPKQWSHAPVINFNYHSHTSTKGNFIEKWIPAYRIPEGYRNPFDKDALQSNTKKCQLCDTSIIEYGIITHKERKEFLIVGMDCYEVYESDSDKKLKLQLLLDQKTEFIDNLINEEKNKLSEVINNETSIRDYQAYSTIVRKRWITWSKVKFTNFITKHASYLESLGYEPNMKLGYKPYLSFYRKLLDKKLLTSINEFAFSVVEKRLGKKKLIENSHYYRYGIYNKVFKIKNKKEYTVGQHYHNINDKLKTLSLNDMKRMIDEKYSIKDKFNMRGWKIK